MRGARRLSDPGTLDHRRIRGDHNCHAVGSRRGHVRSIRRADQELRNVELPIRRRFAREAHDLRFTVTGAPDGPQRTVLRLRQAIANPAEPFCDELDQCWHYVHVSARTVQGGWNESTTWETAPPAGELLGTAPDNKVRGYHSLVDLDLGTFVNGDGIYEIALTSNTSTNDTFASRELVAC